ncbi:MAG: SurA N-terminal domain-containing protein [Gammaproteobacteria bacterium]|nr:SurA N-terminal domain-containing protein [Gammaproteobacteria bacterium]
MLLDLREYVRNSKPVKYTLITIISIPFALVGINSYFTGGGLSYAAKVDGEEVGLREFEQAYFQQRQQLQRMFGGEIPEGFNNEGLLRQQALDSLLTQQALRNKVAEHGFAVSDKTLADSIRQLPIFQSEGVFDPELYRRELQSRGMSVDQFEESLRQDTALDQYRRGIVETAFILPAEQQRLNQLANQIRKTDYIRFSIDDRKTSTEISDDEIQTWFDDHADEYEFPQRVKIQYVELDREQIRENIEIPDADAQTYFDENSGRYIVDEERKASHILLEVDGDLDEKMSQMNDIKARIEAGEDFGALAEEFSSDVGSASNGGSLGQFGKGAMVPPFEAAVFALTEAGAISEPVETEFGIHLIRLDEIVAERGKSFDEVKDEIVDILSLEAANTEYLDLVEILSQQAYDNPGSLDAAAESTGLEINTSDWIDGTDTADPVLGNPQVLSTALSDLVLQDGNNSDLVEIGDRHTMVLRVLEHEGPRPKTLEDVREDIVEQLKTDKAGQALDDLVTTVLSASQDGGDLNELAEEHGGELFAGQELTRNSAELDRNAIANVFKLAKPEADAPVYDSMQLDNGDRVLLVLRELLDAPEADSDSETSGETPVEEALVGAPDPRLGNTEFTLVLENLRANAEVETNPQILEPVEPYP